MTVFAKVAGVFSNIEDTPTGGGGSSTPLVRGIQNTGVIYDAVLADGVTAFTNTTPGTYGTDYFREIDDEQHTSLASWQFLTAKGWRHDRLSFRWEHLQPALNGPLDSRNVARITAELDGLHTVGVQALLVPQNFGHYKTADSPSPAAGLGGWSLGQPGLPYTAFQDFWRRVVQQWGGHPAVYGWELMNEPAGIATTPVQPFTAVRTVSDGSDVSGWSTFTSGTFAVTSAEAHSGATSIGWNVPTGGQWALMPEFPASQKNRSGGGANLVSAWIYVDSDVQGVTVTPAWQGRDTGTSLTLGDSTAVQLGGWTQVVFTPTQPMTDIRRYAFFVQGTGFNGTRRIYFDDIQEGTGQYKTGLQNWKDASQAAVAAIRAHGDIHPIVVGGYNYSAAHGYSTLNGSPWVTDPLGDRDKLIYAAHHYFDASRSGIYAGQSPADVYGSQVAAKAQVVSEAKEFTDWLEQYNVRGAFTEVGWANTTYSTEWNDVANAWLDHADQHHVHWWYFATGTTWYGADFVVYTFNAFWGGLGHLNGNSGQSATLEARLH